MSDKPNEPTLDELFAAIKGRCDAATEALRHVDGSDDAELGRSFRGARGDIALSHTDVPPLLELVEYYRNRACLAAPSPTAVVMMDCHGVRILSGEEGDDG